MDIHFLISKRLSTLLKFLLKEYSLNLDIQGV